MQITFQNKRLIGIVLTVALILLIPFVAMRFTNEVDWKLLDFTIMGVLLLGTGLLCELVLRTVKKIELPDRHLRGYSPGALPHLGGTCGRHLWDTVRRIVDSI